MIKSLRPVPSFEAKIPWTRRSPRKWTLQQVMYVGFNASYTIAVFNNITEKNSAIGNTFKRYRESADRVQTNFIYQKLENAPELIISYM